MSMGPPSGGTADSTSAARGRRRNVDLGYPPCMPARASLLLMACLLAGCGTEPAGLEGRLHADDRWVEAYVLHTDLYRGATIALYPGGRAALFLSHLGGGTDYIGTWQATSGQIRVRLPGAQELTGGVWRAGHCCEPPERIVLRHVGRTTWVQTLNTLEFGSKHWPRDWTFQGPRRISRREMARDLAFVTREAWEAQIEDEVELEEVEEDD